MTLWQAILWGLAILGAAAAIYGLHRLGLRLEERGWIYYWHKKPSGSAAGAFVAMQKAIEPRVQYVLQVEEEKQSHAEGEAPGDLDRPAPPPNEPVSPPNDLGA
jgi:hypothetical protein